MSEVINSEFNFKTFAWQQFKKNKPALVSFYILLFLIFIALFAPFIANKQPLYLKYKGTTFYPAFTTLVNESKVDSVYDETLDEHILFQYDLIDWRQVELDAVVWPLIAYSPSSIDKYNRDYADPSVEQRMKNFSGEIVPLPTRLHHFMGTDKLGRDVASGVVHGTKISLLVGVVSMGIACAIGILLGSLAGYFGNEGLSTSRIQYWLGVVGVFIGYFYAFIARSLVLKESFQEGLFSGVFTLFTSLVLWFLIICMFVQLGKLFRNISILGEVVNIPVDSIISRAIEVLNSLPILILIITISAVLSEKSLWVLMVIIGLTGWTGVARLMRAEMLRVKEMEYIQAGKALGMSNLRILTKHAVPNGLGPVFVSFAFGVASAILTESGLSFLGIGVPDDIVTWGSLLNLGKNEFEAWWLVMYPGLAIFITITIYNLIGEGLRDALDPKLKK